MIHYENRPGFGLLARMLQRKGSVFPRSMLVALPCAFVSMGLKIAIDHNSWDWAGSFGQHLVPGESGAWSGFSFLVGFLIVFRTVQSYNRFSDGSNHMQIMHSEWFDSCSNVVAFCIASTADKETTFKFKHLIVRMYSLLHVLALAEIEDSCKDDITSVHAFRMEVIDIHGLDPQTLKAIKESDSKVELVFTWIQQLIVANIKTGVLIVPPPILSRVFQELSNGMVQFDQAMKVNLVPFPFPYAQTCDALMLFHWIGLPFVVAGWATNPFWAGALTFIQVFIVWSLNFIAIELENPYGRDENDLDAGRLHSTFNRHLFMLLSREEDMLPSLAPGALTNIDDMLREDHRCASTLASAWLEVDEHSTPARSAKRRLAQVPVHQVVRRVTQRLRSAHDVSASMQNTFTRKTPAKSEQSLTKGGSAHTADSLSSESVDPRPDQEAHIDASALHLSRGEQPCNRAATEIRDLREVEEPTPISKDY